MHKVSIIHRMSPYSISRITTKDQCITNTLAMFHFCQEQNGLIGTITKLCLTYLIYCLIYSLLDYTLKDSGNVKNSNIRARTYTLLRKNAIRAICTYMSQLFLDRYHNSPNPKNIPRISPNL